MSNETTTLPDGLTVPVETPAPTEKKAAIVGTAQTWVQTPWDDLSVDIYGLNDGYALGWRKGWAGLPRASGWYDLHPFSQMSFQPKNRTAVHPQEAPQGAYLRPEGHLEFLKSRPFPVYVNQKPADWPATVQEFPRAALEAKYGSYFCSTPAWMLVHLLELGYTEIQIFGIHLATEWEYISQRPNFEFWLRHAIDRGVKIVLPARCPLLKSKHVYAYEPKPDLPLQAINLRMGLIKQEGAQLRNKLAALPWYERGLKADLDARLQVLDLELSDARQAQRRAQTVLHAA